MDKRKATIATVMILAVVFGSAWTLGYFGGSDPVVAELQQLRDEMFANRDLPEAERRDQWQNLRQRMESLTDEQRDALRRDGRERWQQFGQQRMDEFFALPPDQQQRRLDEILDRMLERQRERAQNPDARNRGDRGDRGGRGRNLTDDQRDERRKRRLDRIDPKMRAQFGEFRRRLDERAQERGLPPMQDRPGGGGRFFRG